jgi:hypothetical protein
MPPFLLSSTILAVAACAHIQPTPTIQPAFNCASLIPKGLKAPVPGTPLPAENADAGDLWVALDGQTKQLDTANSHTADVIDLATACEAAKAAAEVHLAPKRPWWRLW